MTEKNDCSHYGCPGPQGGECFMASQVQNQAEHGSASRMGPNIWPRQNWKDYLERVRTNVLPLCVKSDLLREALKITPRFEDENGG